MTHDANSEEHDNQVHTTPEEGHPAGDAERSDRDIGGPRTDGEESGDDVTGGAKGTRESEFDSH